MRRTTFHALAIQSISERVRTTLFITIQYNATLQTKFSRDIEPGRIECAELRGRFKIITSGMKLISLQSNFAHYLSDYTRLNTNAEVFMYIYNSQLISNASLFCLTFAQVCDRHRLQRSSYVCSTQSAQLNVINSSQNEPMYTKIVYVSFDLEYNLCDNSVENLCI